MPAAARASRGSHPGSNRFASDAVSFRPPEQTCVVRSFLRQWANLVRYAMELSHGNHFYWPELDVDLDMERIQHPVKFPLIAK